jgi:hypothetical protein
MRRGIGPGPRRRNDAVFERYERVSATKVPVRGRKQRPRDFRHGLIGENENKTKLYALDEMDADHVAAWSKGGESSPKKCQMLCSTLNRAKGSR